MRRRAPSARAVAANLAVLQLLSCAAGTPVPLRHQNTQEGAVPVVKASPTGARHGFASPEQQPVLLKTDECRG